MREVRARYEIVREESDNAALVIRDVGPWDRHPTVTNDAEAVVEALLDRGHVGYGRRLLCYDSGGMLDELVLDERGFVRFEPYPHARYVGFPHEDQEAQR